MRSECCDNRPSLIPLMRLTALTALGFLAAAVLTQRFFQMSDRAAAAAAAAALTTLLAFGLPALLSRKFSGESGKNADLKAPRWTTCLAMIAAALVLQPTLQAAAELTRIALEHLLSPTTFASWWQAQTARAEMIGRIAAVGDWSGFPAAALSLALLPALCEELFFRATLQPIVCRFVRSDAGSILLVSAIFTAVHADWLNTPGIFLCSVLLGYSYLWSGNLWRVVVFHAASNLWNLLPLYAPDFWTGFSPGWSAVAGLPLAFVLLRYAAGKGLFLRTRR